MAEVSLDDLLLRWQELQERGQSLTAAELCRDCPELAEPLQQKIEVAKAMGALLGGGDATAEHAAGPRPVQMASSPPITGYDVLSELGRGGMGVVYLARQLSVGRLVALKMLSQQASSEERARFRAEVETIGQLQHPNLIQVFEVGEQGGRAYYSMEYVKGINLRDQIGGRPQGARRSAELVETLARAMEVVHRQGIIHRDLKPANVLIGTDGVPKISDFGLAKRLDAAELTASGAILGTPSFMAPEQATGQLKAIGPATDVYALGAILYALLTGRPPFQSENAWDTIVQVGSAEPVPPSRLVPKVPAELETICLKCLNKSPQQRYAGALALAEDLRRWLAGEPISARPTGPLGRAVKWARRRPAAAALLAVSLAALLTIVLGSWLHTVRLHRALDQVQASAEESRQRLVSLCVARGNRLLDAGDALGALAWLSEALRLEEGDPDREHFHRVRLAAALRSCPRLVQLWTHDGPVRQAVFSPDGKQVLTTSDDRTARVWDVASGQPVVPPLPHEGAVIDGYFSPDGLAVLTASEDGAARLWSIQRGELLLPPMRHDRPLNSVAFRPDGKQAVTASEDGTARIWDLKTGKPVGPPLQHQAGVEWAEFSPDARRVATASDDHTARVWDAASGQPVGPPLRHQGPVYGASFHPDGSRVVTASDDGTARLWDVETGKPLLGPLHHRRGVYRARFTPDGRKVVTGSDDHTTLIWSAETGQPLTAPLAALSGVNWLECSRDSRLLATANDDNTARIWDLRSGDPLTPLLLHNGAVNAVYFSADQRFLVSAGNDGAARVWDLAALPASRESPWPAPSFQPPAAGRWASRDGSRVVTAERGYTAQIRDGQTGQPIGPPLQHSSTVLTAAFSEDNRLVITGSDDDAARIWDAARGVLHAHPFRHNGAVTAVAFSPDARLAVTVSSDRQARVWSVRSGEAITPPRLLDGPVKQAVFAGPDTVRFLAATGPASEWDLHPDLRSVAELRELSQLLSGQRVENAGLQSLTLAEIQAAWRNLLGRSPELGMPR